VFSGRLVVDVLRGRWVGLGAQWGLTGKVITLNTANTVYLILSSYQEKGYLDFQMERFTVSDFVDVFCAYRKVLSCKAVLTYVQTTCRVV